MMKEQLDDFFSNTGMLAVDCCRNLEMSNHDGRESEDNGPSSMDTECDTQDQEDSSPLLDVDPQVQPT